MFCTKCGKPIPQGAKFCPHCGATQVVIDRVSQQVSSVTAPEAPAPQAPAPEVAKVRPWIRFLARMFDILLAAFLIGAAVAYFYPAVISTQDGANLVGLASLFVWVFIESFLLATTGTTPGKWLFNICLVPPKGEKPDYSTAFLRSIKVWWRGLGIGFPLVSLFTLAVAYSNLKKNGITTWDKDDGFTVVHGRIGLLRVLFAIVFFSASLALVAFSNFLTSTPATSTKTAGMDYAAETSGAKPWERVYKPAETAGMDAENEVVKLRKAAEQGDAKAQYGIGLMYKNGRGVSQDYAQAVAWFRKAAEQGYADAQVVLGLMYGMGRGVPQDDMQAVAWYRKAAEQGLANAQVALGLMYGMGRGVPQDYAQEVAWLRKAAEQGNARAQNILGNSYAQGEGVPQDYVMAYALHNLSAASGDSDAIKARDLVAKIISQNELSEAQAISRSWKPGMPLGR